jgi:Na+-driven multidrug efflux pump
MTLITAMIARYGPEAVAGFGVASRIESLVLVIFYALSSVIGPFVGQNLSAGKDRRIQLSLNLCAMFWRLPPISCRRCLAKTPTLPM